VQLNVYVPTPRAGVVARLDRIVERLGRNKNDVVLDAIEQKVAELEARLRSDRPQFEAFSIGVGEFQRADLYEDRLGS
jgi:hypothetical protein